MTILGALVGIALIVFNVIGLELANYFGTMVFFDTLGTAIAGLAFGPWAGAGVGLATNLVIGLKLHRPYLEFLHVNVLCGVAWGLIAWRFPLAPSSEQEVGLYIIATGCAIGILSALLSVPVRMFLGFKTEHILDKVSKQFTGNVIQRFVKIISTEFLLSHFLDKAISTTVGVMVVLEVIRPNPTLPTDVLRAAYHDLIEFFAALYYVIMGISIKSLGVKFEGDEVVALVGPLGFFSVLIAVPVLLMIAGVH
jgi:hypothetical protein